jgi:Ser-Thr-rich glycosyl-phosphatidyl-inositol-anchored membrane family
MKTSYLLCGILFCASATALAQAFTITKTERQGDNLVLYYNLVDSINNRAYTINIYSSSDNYINPLNKLSGDVGLEVKPGGNRKIVWRAKEELGADFTGDIALEVRGKIYIAFVKMDGFNDYQKFKRLRNYKITWTGGRDNSVLNFDLYRGEKKITSFPNIANVGQFTLKFDANVRPGKNYKLKVSDAKNKDDVVWTDTFKIRRKTPLLLKVLPLFGVGYLATTLKSSSTANNDIVDAPCPGCK